MNNDLLILLDKFAIEAMKSMIEAKFPVSKGDIDRISHLSYEMAKSMLSEHAMLDAQVEK